MSHFPFDASRTINGIITVVPPASGQGAIVVSGSNTVGGASYIDFIKVINTSASATNPNKTFRVDGAGAIEIVNSAYSSVIHRIENDGATVMGATSTSGFVTISGSKNVAVGGYGYLNNATPTGLAGAATNPYSLTANSRIQAAEFNATSDERLKNIHGEISVEEAIKLTKNVKPIKFTWKDGEDDGIKAGFSAQQTYKAGFEHLVGIVHNEKLEQTIDEENFVSPKGAQFVVNYEQVIPYHNAVIKHLLEKIEKLEQTITQMQNKQQT